MKKIVLLIIATFLFFGCTSTNYMFENKVQRTGVDFRTGKWLLNDIEAPSSLEDKLNESAIKDFNLYLNDRLTHISNAKGILIKRKTSLNPNKNDLKELKIGTGFDYFINIKANYLKNEIGIISLTNHNHISNEKTTNDVVLEIYDLNSLEIIYSQKVIATTKIPENTKSDVHFSNSSNGMITKAYKKLIKDLSKKSIK